MSEINVVVKCPYCKAMQKHLIEREKLNGYNMVQCRLGTNELCGKSFLVKVQVEYSSETFLIVPSSSMKDWRIK